MFDFLLVGQGLAGTILSHRLLQRGCSFQIIADEFTGTSSEVAAGLINPITGRRLVKSWRFEELRASLEPFYQELEQTLEQRFIFPLSIIRILKDAKAQNLWDVQTTKPGYEFYIASKVDQAAFSEVIRDFPSYGQVNGGYTVDWPGLLRAYRRRLIAENRLISTRLKHSALQKSPEGWHYQGQTYRRVIFCEGQAVRHNPWFQYLPFEYAKGEVLLIRLQEGTLKAAVKHRMLLVPLPSGLIWAGSNYERGASDIQPTPGVKERIVEHIESLIKVPWKVEEHRIAIRPTTYDRRPFLGEHPEAKGLYIFNGLGTKGSSLAPFWSDHLLDHLLEGQALDEQVSIYRV